MKYISLYRESKKQFLIKIYDATKRLNGGNMKKITTMILTLTMILAMFTTANAETILSDIKVNDWFYNDVKQMIDLGVVDGYTDGTFKPQGAVKVEEFIKMLIVALGYDAKPSDSTYWADGFIQRAEELKISDKSFINDYRLSLTREQAAKIIANALSLNEMRPLDLYYEHVKPIIKDFYLIQDKYKEDVADCYAWGIMQGDNKKLVNPQKSISRAEAATILLRTINKERRIKLELNGVKVIELETNEQTPGLLVAPKYNGVILNEMIDLVEAIKSVENETAGVEQYVLNMLGNGFGITSYENQRKYQEYYDFNTRGINGEINETNVVQELNKVIYHQDWNLAVSLIEFHNKRTPYIMTIRNRYSIADDETCNSNYEYMMRYHKKTFQAMFKVWFENEYEKAWNIFEKALKHTDNIAKGEELTINNRNFHIAYDNTMVVFSVSVKLK